MQSLEHPLAVFESWAHSSTAVVWAAVAVLSFVGTLLAVPFAVARLPADYFTREKRVPLRSSRSWRRWFWLGLKNFLGLLLLLVGVVMLALPGQGVLTILVALMLLDFPGKYRLEVWLVRRRSVARALGWMRRRARQPPFELPGTQRSDRASRP